MSIAKDLAFIFLFLIILIKYIFLLKEFYKQKEYFIQTLSHDFRVSTLAQIRALNLLSKNPNNVELFSELDNSCKYSLEILNMLLKTFRYEGGEEVLDRKFFKFSEMFSQISSNISQLAVDKQISLIHDICEDDMVNADKAELQKVLQNLISTAICYAEKGSKIKIMVKDTFGNLKVSIKYFGQCLTEEESSRMLDKSPRFSTVGHGIKMHLCKKIIDFHKGELSFYNINGNLNVFEFRLPKSQNMKVLQPFFSLKSCIMSE